MRADNRLFVNATHNVIDDDNRVVVQYPAMMILDEALLYSRIGDAIRRRRSDLGMTQGQLAEAAGVLRTSVANVEAGRQRAPLHLVYRLCVALGVEVSAIIPRVGEVARPATVEVDVGNGVVDMPPKSAELLRELWQKQAKEGREGESS